MTKRGERASHCKNGHPFEGPNLVVIQRFRSGRIEEYQSCRTCRRDISRRARERGYNENWQLQNRYGITARERDAILEAQGGTCALCERPAVVVDHDHETGHVRGMLCKACNVALGVLGDSEDAIRSVLAYLTQDRNQGVV